MLETMLEDLLSPPKEGIETLIQLGEKVTIIENVSDLIKDYAKENPEGNEKWLTLASVLETEEKPSFSVLHVAGKGSAYTRGTVIIEIAANEDIEVRGDILMPLGASVNTYIH